MRRIDAYEATHPDGTRVRAVSVRRMPTRLLRTQGAPQVAADVRLPWGVRAGLWVLWGWVATHPPGSQAWRVQAPWVVVTIGGVLLAVGLWLDALLHGPR